MGKLGAANLKKAIYYLKRNGIKNTWYAVKERLEEQKAAPYCFVPVSEEEKARQRRESEGREISFSIVVPAYHTKEEYLREMIFSVAEQTYPHWELVVADASADDSVAEGCKKIIRDIAEKYQEKVAEKIRYVKLTENAGIAENTNQALQYVTKEYTGLLDHDDVLTEDALYEMAVRIEKERKRGVELQMLYSDEDKCNGDRTCYYEPNQKEDFNLDLLLSNNYICHFLVMKSDFMREIGFRSEYDGAQDYDLVLRAAYRLLRNKEQIAHISKVLYHWRCHTGSTAENPQSKQYAYEAGLRALQDFADRADFRAKAVPLKHLGFYTLHYGDNVLECRGDLGAVGGRVIAKGKIIGGRMSEDGEVFYEGLPIAYSGYLHRAVLTQDADAVDIRCIRVREECRQIFERTVGVPYTERENVFDVTTLPETADYKALSLKFAGALRQEGYEILYQPALTSVRKE